MMPKNTRLHAMELRDSAIFKVEHANTERFRKSAVLNMQHLLNYDAMKNQ